MKFRLLILLFALGLFASCGELELPEEEDVENSGNGNGSEEVRPEEDAKPDVPEKADSTLSGSYAGTFSDPYPVSYFLNTGQLKTGFYFVRGYIVGYAGGRNMSSVVFGLPEKDVANIVLADSKEERDGRNCVAVKLTDKDCALQDGTVREMLSLYAHPECLGKYVMIKGEKDELYFGQRGIKSTLDFEWLEDLETSEPDSIPTIERPQDPEKPNEKDDSLAAPGINDTPTYVEEGR